MAGPPRPSARRSLTRPSFHFFFAGSAFFARLTASTANWGRDNLTRPEDLPRIFMVLTLTLHDIKCGWEKAVFFGAKFVHI